MISCIIFTLEGCTHCEKVKRELDTSKFNNIRFQTEVLNDEVMHIYTKYCTNKTKVETKQGDIEVPEIVAPNFFFFEKGNFLGNIAGFEPESLHSVLEQLNDKVSNE